MTNKFITLLLLATLSIAAFGQATVQVLNADGPGEGFNDPTPVAPIGGNPGATVGLQRQIAFSYAAFLWGQQLTSTQVIRVVGWFDALPCTATSGVLGGAGPWYTLRDYPVAPGFPGLIPGTFYPAALAEKLTGRDIGGENAAALGGNIELFAQFNSSLGQTGCLEGGGWYYGLDNNPPAGTTNLVAVLLHEFAHGLGFTVNPTNANTGVRAGGGFPSVWERHMKDLSTGKTWLEMTDSERAASARNTNGLVWTGVGATMAAQQVLANAAETVIASVREVRGTYESQSASFGPPLGFGGLSGIVMPALDDIGDPTDGCQALTADPQKSVKGRIALIRRGTCTFAEKVKNAQDAGAIAVLIDNNVPSGLPGMSGEDPSITIPSVGISQALGDALRALPQLSNPGRGGLPLVIRISATFRSGVSGGFPRLYAPGTFQQGSSVSHWDVSLTPNVLMEPFITPGLSQSLVPPRDLTFPLLQDIGW